MSSWRELIRGHRQVLFSRTLAFVRFVLLIGCCTVLIYETQAGRNNCPQLHFAFKFVLYHAIIALSGLRSINLAYLICISIFGCLDLSQIHEN